MTGTDLITVAQQLLDELRDNSIRSVYQAEGVKLFISRLRELEEKEQQKKVGETPLEETITRVMTGEAAVVP